MKRSEMVEMIHNWYWNNYPKFRAGDLLTLIESEGMIPPGLPSEDKKIMIYRWDDEDVKNS